MHFNCRFCIIKMAFGVGDAQQSRGCHGSCIAVYPESFINLGGCTPPEGHVTDLQNRFVVD